PVEALGDDPDEFEFTSKKKADVKRALQLTFQTIDYAHEFGAPFVILRLGSTPLHGFTEGMMKIAKTGQLHSRAFVYNKIRAIEMREKHTPRTMEMIRDALDHIVTYAGRKSIKIAIKSRGRYEQAPTERELLELMEEFKGNPYVGYWHDFGHVQCKANLGLVDHEQWLKKMQPYILGCHLHDVHWPDSDHCVPLSGGIEYEKLIPLIPPEAPLVWALNQKQKTSDIKRAYAGWEERIGIKDL
ncbi:MAG: TIM barrel protein, partial [Verrucomicrobiota bacterium]